MSPTVGPGLKRFQSGFLAFKFYLLLTRCKKSQWIFCVPQNIARTSLARSKKCVNVMERSGMAGMGFVLNVFEGTLQIIMELLAKKACLDTF